MVDFRFERQCRTPHSEAYDIWEGENKVGRVDLHFTPMAVEASLTVLDAFASDRVSDLVEVIDEELVLPAGVIRDDFVVTVFQGREVGVYSDELLEEDMEEEEEEEAEGHNHHH